MPEPVNLYVYDLSNGLARSMSMQLTGRQIDGIWHTSVVVYDQEVFYGQGIQITRPGRSHHGAPLQKIPMGETEIDQDTFQEYIDELREHYTADKYHLLDFNCNSFTADVASFLTGQSIPSFIKDLPSDFLATPFGAALRPTIDAMYRRPVNGTPVPTQAQQTAQPILQSIASQAQQPQTQATNTLVAPIHMCTNPASFQHILDSHRIVIAFFTSAGCPPCRMIEPSFKELAQEKAADNRHSIAFTQIDLDVGRAREVGTQYSVRVTPTFLFFLDGTRQNELKGADRGELRTLTELLLYEAYPPHPHTKLPLRETKKIDLKPILFTQVPAIDGILKKFISLLPADLTQEKDVLTGTFATYLKAITVNPQHVLPPADVSKTWISLSQALTSRLSYAQLFPWVDLCRLFSLHSSAPYINDALAMDLMNALQLHHPNALSKEDRNTNLTLLKFSCNQSLTTANNQILISSLLVPSLLSEDNAIRTTSSSLAFNFCLRAYQARDSAGNNGFEWEIDLLSALLETLTKEKEEDVIHRLVAGLALLLWRAPISGEINELAEVMAAKQILGDKIKEIKFKKVEVVRLIDEITRDLLV